MPKPAFKWPRRHSREPSGPLEVPVLKVKPGRSPNRNPPSLKVGITDEQLLATLRQNAGLVAQSAEALGVAYQTVYERVRNHPEWAVIIAEARSKVTDIAEAHFINQVRKGKEGAIDKWLRYHAKDRGYVTGIELSGPGGGPVPIAGAVDVTIKLVRAKPVKD